MSFCIQIIRRFAVVAVLGAAFVGVAAPSAEARVFIGIGIPFGGFYPPPYYYPPPPVYYAPPPVVYAPPQTYAPPPQAYSPAPQVAGPGGAGQACYAGPYVCPMDRAKASGGRCFCLGNGGESVWGRTN